MPAAVPAGTYTAMVTASGQQGSTSVPVTISVACSGTAPVTFPQQSYTFTTSACAAGTSVGSAAGSNAIQYTMSNGLFTISTNGQISLPSLTPAGTYFTVISGFGAQSSSSVGATITVTCSSSGTNTGAVTFPQASYSFSTSTCTAGTTVGSVVGTNVNRYSGSASQFSISSTGQITIPSTLPPGTYVTQVTGVGTQNQASVMAIISVNCAGSTPSTTTFPQTSYTFSTSTCTAGSTVGTTAASNANRYTISNTQFTIAAAGQIALTNAITAGTYSATVTGFGNVGSAAVPVTITVACGSNPSTGTGTCAANVSPTYSGSTTCSASSSDLGYPITAPQVSAADITAILDAHNTYRRGVDATNMRKLRWDPCIASSAQAWASRCDATNPHDSYAARKAPGFPQGCGQNKASGTSGFITWKTAIDLWYNEVKDFTYCSSNNVFAKVGHYTQVMWAETSLIGCGFARCNGMDAFICNYCTPGNFGSEPAIFCPWKQGTSATKCSACPTGSGCTAGDCLCA